MSSIANLGFFERVKLLSFLQANLKNPDAIIQSYKKEPEKWEALKASFPVYKDYLAGYPELVKALHKGGVPL